MQHETIAADTDRGDSWNLTVVVTRLTLVTKGLAFTLILMMVVACAPPVATTATITGRLVAGPVCPVETDPPDPACLPHPVADAEVVATDVAGNVFRGMSSDTGSFRLAVSAGKIVVTFPEVEGLMAAPDAIEVTVARGESVDLGAIAFDTGIR